MRPPAAVVLAKKESRRWTWLADSVFLFVMAATLVRPIYRAEYLNAWNSIESTFISDARFLRENWPHPAWQPNWYGGTRFDYVYPPALRYGTAAISRWKGYSTARAYHIYIYVLYGIAIVGVYWLVRAGSRRRAIAVWTAVASALVSPCFLLFRSFLFDYGRLHWMPLRLGVLIRYGEGPHMSAFALLPFALAAAWYGLRRGRAGSLAAAAVVSALVVAHNFYGATALAMLFPILVWSVWLAEQDGRVWLRAGAIAALAWGLCAFWLTPSYVRVTLDNMALVSSPGHGWSAALGAVALAAYACVSYRVARGRPERAWASFVFGSVALVGLNVIGNQYFDFRIMGEPGRLIPELDLLILMAAAVVWGWMSGRGRAGKAVAALLAIVCVIPAIGYARNAWRVLPPRASHTDRIEFTLTRWMHENLPGVRALATGSVRFWYNAWYDLPQLGGGSEQGLYNINSMYGYGQAIGNDDSEFCIAWLQAMGTGAVIVHDKTSAEVYHDWPDPGKFEGRLEVLYDDHAGNRIYRVPRREPGLARVVDAATARGIPASPPEPNRESVMRYAAMAEAGLGDAKQHWTSASGMVVEAQVAAGQLVLVQESYDPGWRAYEGGRRLAIERDALGQMLLDAGPGNHQIRLRFERPLENQVGAALTLVSLAVAAGLFAKASRR